MFYDHYIKIFSNNYEIIYILFLIIIVSFYILFNYIKYKDFKFKYHYNILMIAEGLVYGLLLIILINGFEIFNFNFLYIKENIFLHFYYCLGAGVWEEIFFRLFIFNILFYIFSKFIFNIDNSYILAILFSSILFSYFHYIGNFADSFIWSIFIIRFIAGIYLCIIYVILYRVFPQTTSADRCSHVLHKKRLGHSGSALA